MEHEEREVGWRKGVQKGWPTAGEDRPSPGHCALPAVALDHSNCTTFYLYSCKSFSASTLQVDWKPPFGFISGRLWTWMVAMVRLDSTKLAHNRIRGIRRWRGNQQAQNFKLWRRHDSSSTCGGDMREKDLNIRVYFLCPEKLESTIFIGDRLHHPKFEMLSQSIFTSQISESEMGGYAGSSRINFSVNSDLYMLSLDMFL